MTMRLFTLVHGQPYLAWMRNGLLTSLMWPTNLAAIRNAVWHIYTSEESREETVDIVKDSGLSIVVHMVKPEWGGQLLANAIRECIMDCAAEGDSMLVCPPDTIFGEQSIETMVAVAREPKIIVSAPPVRVNQEFMEDFTGERITNAQLVSLAWKHLHATWRDANIQLSHTNSFAGGVSWKQIGHKLYSVTHLLPTPFLIQPAPSDGEWFRLYGTPGSWDHLWPAKLVDEGRQRLIASSDAAFCVEVTMKDTNIPPLYPTDPINPSLYVGSNKHNHVNRNTVCVFRGE